jgi:hypothetical protein
MDTSLKELIDLAYTFYPRYIRESDEKLYYNSEENKLLTEKIYDGKKKYELTWKSFCDDLRNSILISEGFSFEELPTNSYNRCFKAVISSKAQKLTVETNFVKEKFDKQNLPYPVSIDNTLFYEEKIGIYISLLIPFFSFCEIKSIYRLGIDSKTFNIDRNNTIIKTVTKSMSKKFPSFQKFDPYYSYCIVDDIEIDMSSYSYEGIANEERSCMTLFHAFFTSRFL